MIDGGLWQLQSCWEQQLRFASALRATSDGDGCCPCRPCFKHLGAFMQLPVLALTRMPVGAVTSVIMHAGVPQRLPHQPFGSQPQSLQHIQVRSPAQEANQHSSCSSAAASIGAGSLCSSCSDLPRSDAEAVT
jgi:hypothetical protein